ncbi:MAG: T9SS type A sorting domain-containing protein, partial [Bacteroidia bacterium]
ITKGGCTVESPCFSFTFVGVETQSEQRAKIYPNPASDNVVIELAELHPNTTMTVVDVTGKVVKEMAVTTKRNTINVSEFASGVYFVKITSEQGINTVKFVKK